MANKNVNSNPSNKRSEYLRSIREQEAESRYNTKLDGEDEYTEEYGEDDDYEDTGKSHIFHYAFFAIAAFLIIGSIVLLVRWNKGRVLVINPDELSEDYSTECLDWYSHFDPAENPEYVDDGVQNILIIGDDSIYYYNDETGIPALLAAYTGANVTTLAIPGTTISLSRETYSTEHPEEAFSLYYQAVQITAGGRGSYDLMEAAAPLTDNEALYLDYIEQLKSIDYDSIDVLIICYGLNDYLQGHPYAAEYEDMWSQRPLGNPDVVKAALDDVFTMFRNRFPYMQIIYASPTFFMEAQPDGSLLSSHESKNGISTFADYIANYSTVASKDSVSFVDNYFGFIINEENYTNYLDPTNLYYPNEYGRKLIVDHISQFIYYIRNNPS